VSSGRAGPGALLQAMLQGILEGEGPVGHYLKVLKGVLLIERSVAGSSFLVPRFWAFVLGVLFLNPRSWVFILLLAGRFVLGSSFLAFLSWALRVLGALGALATCTKVG
jgi:hypothetical protein